MKNEIPDHAKYITTQEFNKLTRENFAARLTQANLVSKTDFNNKLIITFNRKITENKTKYLEVFLFNKKLDILTTKDYTFFLEIMYFTSNGGSQSTLVYQSTLDKLESREELYYSYTTDHIRRWKSKRKYSSKFKSLYIAFSHRIKLSGCRMGIKIDKDLLSLKQNNYLRKIINVYIVYDLDAWPRIAYLE